MKFQTSCFVAIILFGPTLQMWDSPATRGQNEKMPKPGLHDILLKTVSDTASYLGFGVKCLNGGHKTEENTCICPKHFKGKECETKICINHGKLEKVTIPTVHHVCKCPHPEFITGEHCEKIRCANYGEFQAFPTNATWRCDCKGSRFYQGEFCEKFVLSSGWVAALACFAVFVIVAFICSSNWFSRNRTRRSSRHSHSQSQRTTRSRDALRRVIEPSMDNPRGVAHRSASSDELISSERGAHRRTQAFPAGGITQQYVVRLDTIPTFNPSMIGGVEPMNPSDARPAIPVGPPPSYDQAMSSIRSEPPSYTPTAAKNETDS
ncbi:hypothetical protein B9Z55_000569 [Caenorhabditis nigoni]|nr:hypothetical protein B9Z55_000569 [Caenorhabditis nigoni]